MHSLVDANDFDNLAHADLAQRRVVPSFFPGFGGYTRDEGQRLLTLGAQISQNLVNRLTGAPCHVLVVPTV
jgi:hypothetical protein